MIKVPYVRTLGDKELCPSFADLHCVITVYLYTYLTSISYALILNSKINLGVKNELNRRKILSIRKFILRTYFGTLSSLPVNKDVNI